MRLPFRSKHLLALAVAVTAVPATILPLAVPASAVTAGAAGAEAVTTGAVTTGATTAGRPLAEPEIPDSPAGRQLRWFLGAPDRAPLAESELGERFNSGYLSSLTANGLNAFLASAKGFRLEKLTRETPSSLAGIGAIGEQAFVLQLGVDGDGKINLLGLTPPAPPVPAAPKSWKQLDTRLREVAPRVGFLAAEIDSRGRCDVAHAVAPDTVRPIGSIFKLYVLGAVAEKIRDGGLRWNTKLTIKPEWKSVGEDGLTSRPDGSTTTVREAAKLMISISDNTATDILIHTVGRKAVEAKVRRWSSHPERNIPLLTTREIFLLKGVNHPTQARAYLALDTAGKRAYLKDTVAKQSLSDIVLWTKPREIDTVEWFGSPRDVCRAYAGLLKLGGKEVSAVMSANDLGLGLDRKKWPVVWAKGGSEMGVFDLSYLARSAGGRTYVVTALTSDPASALDERVMTPELISLSRGGFALAGRK
ncbi:serine hydrolase [Streptosporangium sp. NBC_01495]|uniref:serine hydrolase n=1 Tax=Streptosporangium sp. NBC_01495 TaxID=2903899 RepID=UPI002E33056C|nr:serine hydrolase [Streptosporangium sp. NBC_01495]